MALVDLIALSRADMMIYLSSKFPKVAEERALCPQRALQVGKSTRHNVMKMGYMLTPHQKFEPHGSPIKDTVTEKEMATLNDVVPTRPNGQKHPCKPPFFWHSFDLGFFILLLKEG